MDRDGLDLNGEPYGWCLSSFIDDGSTESHRYYLSRRTVLEMLRDRGYAVPNSEIELSLQDFRSIHTQRPDVDRLCISASLRSDPSNKVDLQEFFYCNLWNRAGPSLGDGKRYFCTYISSQASPSDPSRAGALCQNPSFEIFEFGRSKHRVAIFLQSLDQGDFIASLFLEILYDVINS